eukprot:NODE_599_length_5524_cov_0.451060.p1 type:complete len:932 gc:universal NODE_599_length_5524_cov_0.451060:2566-5361(+)
MSKANPVPANAKLQILLNRVLEKDFKADMEVEAFASQSTVEELFVAYKQVDQRVKKSSKELERYYYNNYYSFIESAKEQIDITKLLEQVNTKLASQYIPLLEEINSSFEGIRDQLADELMRYEQMKKYSVAKKQSGWVVDLFVNLEKSYHRIKGLTPLQPKHQGFKEINYKVYGYIIRCAYHIKNYFLLQGYPKQSEAILAIVEKCKTVLPRIASLFENLLKNACSYSGSWALEYPILLVIHCFLVKLNIESNINVLVEEKFAVIFNAYKEQFKGLISTDIKETININTTEMFLKMRNLIMRDINLMVLTSNCLTTNNAEPLNCDSSNIKIIFNHLTQIRLILEPPQCLSVGLLFSEIFENFLEEDNQLIRLTAQLYTDLIRYSLRKDFLGENFNASKLIHLLRNLKAECHEAASFPFEFLLATDRNSPMKVDENVVNFVLKNESTIHSTNFKYTQVFFHRIGNNLLSIVVREAVKCSILEVNVKLRDSLKECMKVIGPLASSKTIANGLLDTEKVLERTLNETVRKQLKKLRKSLNESNLWFPGQSENFIFQESIISELQNFWKQIGNMKLDDPNSELLLSRICFDSDMHIIDSCFSKFLPLVADKFEGSLSPDVVAQFKENDFDEENDDSSPSLSMERLGLYNTLNLGVGELREIVRDRAKYKLGNYILYHALELSKKMDGFLEDLDIGRERKSIEKYIVSPQLCTCITYIMAIEKFASVIFDEMAREDLYAKRPPVQKKSHAKKYSLDDRFSDRESMSSTMSPTKNDSKSVVSSNHVLNAPKMNNSYMSHVHKLFRKHVDFFPQLPSLLIQNDLKVRVDFTKEAVIEHLLLVIIKHLTEGLKNRVTIFHRNSLTPIQYEQIYIDIEYLKMIIRLSATKLESSVLDDKFLMILLDEARSYAFQLCLSPRSPDTKLLNQLLEEERVKLAK